MPEDCLIPEDPITDENRAAHEERERERAVKLEQLKAEIMAIPDREHLGRPLTHAEIEAQYNKAFASGPAPDISAPAVIFKFTPEEIDFLFTYHPPRNQEEALNYEAITSAFRRLAQFLAQTLPPGPGKTIAIRALVDARMKANASIALAGRF